MKQVFATLVFFLAVSLKLAAQDFAQPGQLFVDVNIDGRDQSQNCRTYAYPVAHPEELALDGLSANGLTLAPDTYRLRLVCKSDTGPMIKVLNKVRLRSGQNLHKKISLRRSWIIVNTSREGARLEAELSLHDSNTDVVIAKGFSGNKLLAPAGSYSLRISYASSQQADAVSQVARRVTLKSGHTLRIKQDLSDSQIRVNIRNNGQRAEGVVSLFAPGSTEPLMEFAAGTDQLVPAASYDLRVSIDSAYDFSSQGPRRIKLKARQKKTLVVNFHLAQLSVDSQIQGVSVKAKVYLFRPGAPEHFNFAESQEPIPLSPGKYKVRVVPDDSVAYDAVRPEDYGEERTITLRSGQKQKLRVDLSPGYLLITAKKNGKASPAAVSLWLHKPKIKLGGAAAGDTLAVAAGRYDVELLFPNGRGGDVKLLKNIQVRPGKTTSRSINIERGTLTIDSYDRGVRVDAKIMFFRKNSQAPVRVVRGGEAAELPPGVYEVQMRFEGKQRWVSAMRVTAGSWDVRKVEF